MCFARTFTTGDLHELDQLISDNVPFDLYIRACWLISRLVETVTGIKRKCIAMIQRNILIPHYVNISRDGTIIDLKRRSCVVTRNQIIPSWSSDGREYGPGREYVVNDIQWNNACKYGEYIQFIETDNDEVFKSGGWQPYYTDIIEKWYFGESEGTLTIRKS